MTDVSPTDAGQESDAGRRYTVEVGSGTRHQSPVGYWFDEIEPVWVLDKNVTVNVNSVSSLLAASSRYSYIKTLSHYGRTKSANHVQNMNSRMGALLRIMATDSISTTALINYRATLTRETEHHLGALRGFLYKWCDLGYPGIDDDVIDLLKSWTLKGNTKGDAVKRLDPNEGPLTDNELTAFNEGAVRSFEVNKILLDELAQCLLISHTGRRPKQIAHTKNCDLDGTKTNKKGEPMYLIHIPRAKQRGEAFRGSFKTFAMSLELWTVLSAQRKNSIASVERVLGYELQEADREALPLFPDITAFESGQSVVELRSLLATDHLHLPSAQVTATLKKAVAAAGILSERTGQLLDVVATRFRYTKGTRAAREGYGLMVIAELLDHTDIQNVEVYTKNVPEHAQALNKAMALQLAPYAQAFQGVLVDRESEAKRGGDLSSRIKFKGQSMATCGQYGFCGANAPIPCYTCNHFQPWLDGPHEEVLADVFAERDRVQQITDDAAMAAVNDRTIFAVINVIQRCEARRAELAKMAKEAGK
ncbi:phage integrase family protein [Acidithiobacillus ferrooxidans]|uniref:site-specific integrase n=1 Tax=Acidithiobacillus ferrooxidans TaxID=920 RepID=UPI001C078C34|nr:site-specific integrase [Acidithiobacillus ferrooxidans]MBU2861109.1 phage integrase family protein [Acidithiobacillus ferrooxidans]